MIDKPPSDDSPRTGGDDADEVGWQRAVMAATSYDRGHYFRVAAAQGQLHRMVFLRSHAPDDITPAVINGALAQAAARGHEDVCRQLLAWNADARHERSIALIRAVKGNHGFITDLLLRHGARMDDAKHYGPATFLLAHAIEGINADSAKALLLHGADPNVTPPFSHDNLRTRARELGMVDTNDLMSRLWSKPPAVPDDFATRLPLDTLRGAFPTHDGYTGFQLAVYHGQFDALMTRLTANGRKLQKADLITATPRHPQTLLFILGQRGELAKAFEPALWHGDIATMHDLMRYVPAGFRDQLEAAGVHARLHQESLRQQHRPQLRIKPR